MESVSLSLYFKSILFCFHLIFDTCITYKLISHFTFILAKLYELLQRDFLLEMCIVWWYLVEWISKLRWGEFIYTLPIHTLAGGNTVGKKNCFFGEKSKINNSGSGCNKEFLYTNFKKTSIQEAKYFSLIIIFYRIRNEVSHIFHSNSNK